MLIQYFSSPSSNPFLVKGMIDGTNAKIISQDPSRVDAVPIYRSNNQSTGSEFTWSVWLYINDLGTETKYQNVFNKGDAIYGSNGISKVNNGPGLYLGNGGVTTKMKNNLHIVMDTNNPRDSAVLDIDNIPLRKWVHVAVRLENTILDVYVNGVISGRTVLTNVPKQNYNDVNICQNGGFSGKCQTLDTIVMH